jgi:hypothetical protein
MVQAAAGDAGGGTQKKSYKDERQWKPTVDKAGNGYAVIRFLPALEGQDLPWVRYWDHGFKGPTGQWFIEKSLTSIGQVCPVSEMNNKLWNSGIESDKTIARERKRRLHYVANIYVVSDPSAPENNGKVMMYTFGKKIFDKIMDLMQPQFPGEVPVDPFHFMQGADFQIKIRNVEGYRNYDKSEFSSPAPLLGGDVTQIEAVYNQMHDLSEFTDPSNYKTYEELQARLSAVLGEATPRTVQETVALDEVAPAPEPKVAESAMAAVASVAASEAVVATAAEPDDTMSYFASLAQSD